MSLKKIRAIVVDDEPNSRNLLQSMLEKYCPSVDVIGLAGSAEEAYELITKFRPNLLFLDIEMPHGSGFELLKLLPKIDFYVIFVTGFEHYAVNAIKVNAVDYLLKPLDIDELIKAVKKVKVKRKEKNETENIKQLFQALKIQHDAGQKISIYASGGKEIIPIVDIVYCQADKSYSWITTVNNRYHTSKNLGHYEGILNKSFDNNTYFFRTHHQFLLNLNYVKSYHRKYDSVELTTGEKIPVSFRRRKKFSERMKKFYGDAI